MLAMLMLKVTRQSLEAQLAEEGIDLTMLQHGILSLTKRHQPTIADLSRTMGLDPSTLVPSVDALVKKGYIIRERDPEDRRRYPLYLTEDGQKLYDRMIFDMGSDPLHHALSQMPSVDVTQLAQLLRHVVARLPDGESILQDLDEHIQAHRIDSPDA